jgi:hypothetical protein
VRRLIGIFWGGALGNWGAGVKRRSMLPTHEGNNARRTQKRSGVGRRGWDVDHSHSISLSSIVPTYLWFGGDDFSKIFTNEPMEIVWQSGKPKRKRTFQDKFCPITIHLQRTIQG